MSADGTPATGVDASDLPEEDLVRELEQLHRTRHETFLHGSNDALLAHTDRVSALEREYIRRHPERAVDPGRTREGARERD